MRCCQHCTVVRCAVRVAGWLVAVLVDSGSWRPWARNWGCSCLTAGVLIAVLLSQGTACRISSIRCCRLPAAGAPTQSAAAPHPLRPPRNQPPPAGRRHTQQYAENSTISNKVGHADQRQGSLETDCMTGCWCLVLMSMHHAAALWAEGLDAGLHKVVTDNQDV